MSMMMVVVNELEFLEIETMMVNELKFLVIETMTKE